ncbi:MAG: DUF1156 domain-containing protein [Verrucomicrobiaceae bacterium]|nr:DUF1156 domain-containing protein [Verrucomicrobiaceae bacterium]
MTAYPKRLIEVDLPIRRISDHARREKSIRHGHISTLHIWWARRPLAACRAVLCASLWPDTAPGAGDAPCPPPFLAASRAVMLAWAPYERQALLGAESRPRFEKARQKPEHFDDPLEVRHALLDFIADFANWENSTISAYLDTARYLTAVAHRALTEPEFMLSEEEIASHLRDTKTAIADWPKPLVVDPFAGGGSIPLEALRVGADAFASDLNPIPVLLNKVVLEYIPKYGQRLADEVRKWGAWIKEQAEKELAEFYPKDPDGATPIAYIWARTIRCEGPGCGAEVPLIRSLWLAKKDNRSVALQLTANPETKRVDIRVIAKQKGKWVDQCDESLVCEKPKFDGTVKRGSATCPCCGYTTPVTSVRIQLKATKGGARNARLMAVATTKSTVVGRFYRTERDFDHQVFKRVDECLSRLGKDEFNLTAVPDEPITLDGSHRIVKMLIYGAATWGDFYTARQALALATLARHVRTAPILAAVGNDRGFESAIRTSLALSVDKVADLANSCCRWEPVAECPRQLFARQAIPIVWDFAEGIPIGDSSGAFSIMIDRYAHVLEAVGSNWHVGHAEKCSATEHSLPNDAVQAMVTDPPYYHAIAYATLADFFYPWLKRMLGSSFPELFSTVDVPKAEEVIVDLPHAENRAQKDIAFYERKLTQAFAEGRRVVTPSGIGTIVFASKTTASWEAILQAVVDANWVITGSWPIDTEMETRVAAQGQARLGSSVHLVVRPREDENGNVREDEVGDWRDVLQELPKRLHEWMPRLDAEGVVGADAIFACLGPALEVFSRYSRVERASGEQVTLKEYLEHVWAAVSREALTMVFKDADVSGFEEDARLTAIWLWTLSTAAQGKDMASKVNNRLNEGEDEDDAAEDDEDEGSGSKKKAKLKGFYLDYDAARKIAQGLGAHLEDMKDVVEVKGDTARLLPVAERTARLFGKADPTAAAAPKKKKVDAQLKLDLFAELTNAPAGEAETVWEEKTITKVGDTTLDRVHQSMILFAAGRSEALKRFLVDDGAGKDPKFWRLAQALSALYPPKTEEKRWVDGVMARKKGLGV